MNDLDDTYDDWLRSGDLNVLYTVVLDAAERAARPGPFPPPRPHTSWREADAIPDLVSDLFTARPNVLVTATTATHDQPSLSRYLRRAFENLLKDQAKGTERGQLRRRLETLLTADSRFVRVRHLLAWTLAHLVGRVWQGDIDELVEAAWRERTPTFGLLPRSGPTPRVASAALRAVCATVLAAAGGAVREEDVARVLLERFPSLARPREQPLDEEHDQAGPEVEARSVAPEDSAAAARVANEVLADEDRAVLLAEPGDAVDVARSLSIGRREVQVRLDRIRFACEVAAGDLLDPPDVLRALRHLVSSAGVGSSPREELSDGRDALDE